MCNQRQSLKTCIHREHGVEQLPQRSIINLPYQYAIVQCILLVSQEHPNEVEYFVSAKNPAVP